MNVFSGDVTGFSSFVLIVHINKSVTIIFIVPILEL